MTAQPADAASPSSPDVRLKIGVGSVDGHTVDATWWPRTAALTDELPPLIVALRDHGIRISRVSYNPSTWAPTPNRIQADGRTIRLGWFTSIDPRLLVLSGVDSDRRFTVRAVAPATDGAVPLTAASPAA